VMAGVIAAVVITLQNYWCLRRLQLWQQYGVAPAGGLTAPGVLVVAVVVEALSIAASFRRCPPWASCIASAALGLSVALNPSRGSSYIPSPPPAAVVDHSFWRYAVLQCQLQVLPLPPRQTETAAPSPKVC
jgi:hypothetical protein